MAVTRNDILGFTVNDNWYNTGASLSGFTKATPFTFILSATDGITQAAITNAFQIIWWFGDGTYSTEYSPSHIYQWPGLYEVKVGLYNNTPAVSQSPFTFSTTVTASNFIKDRLTWNTSVSGFYNYSWNDLSVPVSDSALSATTFYGYQSCKSGELSSGPIPLAFNYITSVTDNNQIKFNFYSQNSLSQPWTEVPESQLVNLRPRWRFTTVSASPLDDGLVVDSIAPVSSTEVRINSAGNLDLNGTLVGLSGTIQFYYIDDIPSTVLNASTGVLAFSANPTTLWVTLETINLPNGQEYNLTEPSYSNSSILLSAYYFVRNLNPELIKVTLDGKLNFYNTYWPYAESRFVTTIGSSALSGAPAFASNVTLLNYPINALSANNGSATFSVMLSGEYDPYNINQPSISATFNTSTNPTTGNYLTYDIVNADYLGRSTGGAYIGSFTPYTSTNNAALHVSLIAGRIYYYTDYGPTSSHGYNPLQLNNDVYSSLPQLNTLVELNGQSKTFTVSNFDNTYFARKFNGGFDYGAYLKQIALQPTINENQVLFDVFLSSIAGISATNDETFGGVVYEKIANFTSNNADIYASNVDQFYSLTKLLGLQIDNYNYSIPPTLSRVVDTYSVQQSRVWGARSQFARNFSLSANYLNFGPYLSAFNIFNEVVTVGQKIVLNDVFNQTRYELLEVPPINSYASVTARNLQNKLPLSNYPLSSYPLTTYPLSAFFGWGIKTPIEQYYRVYDYVAQPDSIQKEGLVNWEDPLTTLNESVSSNEDWVKDEGILETIYNYYIHKGLGLIP